MALGGAMLLLVVRRVVAALLVLGVCAAGTVARTASAGEEGAVLQGRVLDAESSEPLAGAVVALPDLDRAVVADADGRYEFRGVGAGPHHITVRFLGYAPQTLHALVPSGGSLEIDIALRPEPVRIPAVDIRGRILVRGLESGDTTKLPDREITIGEIRNHPLLEEPDVFQAAASGEITLDPETPTGIHLEGGASDQAAYLLDGVPVFGPFHAAGLASAWNPDAISRVHVGSFAPSLQYPDALAGTIEGTTRVPGAELRGTGSVSTTQSQITVDGPLARTGFGFLASARTGFAGLLIKKNEASHLQGETGDALGAITGPVLGGRIRLLGYDSENQIDAAAVAGSETLPAPARNEFNWHSRSWGGHWTRSVPGTELRLVGWSAEADAASRWVSLGGPIHLSSDRRDVGFQADVRRGGRAPTTIGVRWARTRTSYHVTADSSGSVESAVSGRTPAFSTFVRHERGFVSSLGIDVGSAMTVAKGIAHVVPRAFLRWNHGAVALAGGYAGSRQFAQSLRNAESIVGSIFPADLYAGIGAGTIPVAHGRQGMVAADYHRDGLRMSLQAYSRASSGLVLVAPRAAEPFATGSYVVGSGTSRGLSVDMSWAASRYGAVASYGMERTRLTYGDTTYVPAHAARHRLEGGIIVYPTATSSIRLGATAAWGRRTTIASGDFEWEACNLIDQGCEFSGSPHYEEAALGTTPLPAYVRVDLGLRHHWHLRIEGRDVTIALFGMATNLLGRANALTYNRDSSGVVSAVEMRPRSPLVVGAEWRF